MARQTRQSAADPRATKDELHALTRARTRIAFALTAAVVVMYFGFIVAVAFARTAMGTLVAPGLSVGIVLGALVIVASWLLTLFYVRWANTRYDPALHRFRRAHPKAASEGGS